MSSISEFSKKRLFCILKGCDQKQHDDESCFGSRIYRVWCSKESEESSIHNYKAGRSMFYKELSKMGFNNRFEIDMTMWLSGTSKSPFSMSYWLWPGKVVFKNLLRFEGPLDREPIRYLVRKRVKDIRNNDRFIGEFQEVINMVWNHARGTKVNYLLKVLKEEESEE